VVDHGFTAQSGLLSNQVAHDALMAKDLYMRVMQARPVPNQFTVQTVKRISVGATL
jgi:hypothetical protein